MVEFIYFYILCLQVWCYIFHSEIIKECLHGFFWSVICPSLPPFFPSFHLNLWSRKDMGEASSPWLSFQTIACPSSSSRSNHFWESSFSIQGDNVGAPSGPRWKCSCHLRKHSFPPRLWQSRAESCPLSRSGSLGHYPGSLDLPCPLCSLNRSHLLELNTQQLVCCYLELKNTSRNQFLRSSQRRDIIPRWVKVKDRMAI